MKTVVAKLKDKGVVDRGWIGVQVQPVTAAIADSLGMRNAEGALVSEAQASGPAAKAGIQSGDVITAVNGDAVRDSRDLAKKIGAIAPGTKVTLGILRKGERQNVTMSLQEMPNDRQVKADMGTQENEGGTPSLGLTLAPADRVGSGDGKGLVITGVKQDSAAAESGLKEGDVILDVAGQVGVERRRHAQGAGQHAQPGPRQRADAGEIRRDDAVCRAAASQGLNRCGSTRACRPEVSVASDGTKLKGTGDEPVPA